MPFLTCKFKIHNPSKRKRSILDFALEEYTRAFQWLLDWAKDHEEELIQNGMYRRERKKKNGETQVVEKYTDKSVVRLLPPQSEIGFALHSSAKDSLRSDVAGSLASYLALKKSDPKTSFPTCRDPHPDAIHNALDKFAAVGADEEDFAVSQAKLLKMARGSVMPLYFKRGDAASQRSSGKAESRNFSLLFNTRKKQLLAVLFLLPQGHELGKPMGIRDSNVVRLDTGEVFRSNSKSAIMVLLQVGRNGWQAHKFVEPAKGGYATVKAAHLIRNDETGEYFLHVAFDFDSPEVYRPKAYLGIDKGILFTAAYAVVDSNGAMIEMARFEDELRELQIKHGEERERLARQGKKITWRHYKRQAYDNILHVLANHLIDQALKHKAQIVVEDIDIKVRGSRVVSRFRKLDRILSYKCQLAGVPFRSVFAAYSSVICHKCGEDLERDDRLVVCSSCEYQGHSDDNAAVNIARRALYRKKDWEKKGGYRAFHRSFANGRGFQTENDFRQVAVTQPVPEATRETK